MSQLLVALALTFGAPALKDKPGPEPTLIGEWLVQSVTVNGNPSEPAVDRWAFAADGTWVIHARGRVFDSGPLTWDPKRSPGTLDLARKSGDGAGSLCRYRIEGDTLILSVGRDPGVRPAGVQPAEQTAVWLLKRAPK